jgi:23S rRNA pseudouridine1911/1915/1917 synthase
VGEKLVVDESYLKQEVPDVELPVIYQDDDVMVIDKPEGLLTHSKGTLNLEPTVASFLNHAIRDPQLTGNRAGIVHRLDRGTSGVMIGAKTRKAMSQLQKQFAKRKAKKEYLAVVEGQIEPAEAIIDAPIMRNPLKPQTFKVGALGKKAITEYHTLKTIEKDGKKYSLIELRPQTGRTHQIRVHLAYVGHPVVGDHVYGHSDGQLMLHSKSLEITLPGGQRKKFEAPAPERFKQFLDE